MASVNDSNNQSQDDTNHVYVEDGAEKSVRLEHPTDGLVPPPPGAPRVRQINGQYQQSWQTEEYSTLKVSVGFIVECPDGVSSEAAYDLASAYTGLAQAAVWRRVLPVLERTGRIPKPSVLKRVAGSDLEAMKWARDTTGIPIEFRIQLGESLAARLAQEQEAALDAAVQRGNADLIPYDDSHLPYRKESASSASNQKGAA